MSDSMPLAQPALRTGDAFFSSEKRKWVDDTRVDPPSGAWQLAPQNISSGFAVGGDVFGEAIYSPQDRNLTSASAPIVSGVMCVAKDKSSTVLQESDIVAITKTSYANSVHTIQKAQLSKISPNSRIAVVAAYHQLSLRVSSSTRGTSVSLACCGPIKLRVKDVAALVPGFLNGGFKLPGDTFILGNKQFLILTPVTKMTHEMRCNMDYL